MSTNGKLNAIRKNYDKLTANERVKLMNAADLRGDADELRALMESAPKIGWTIRHHYGIRTALIELEIVEALSLCHLSAELFRVMFLRMAVGFDTHNIPKGDIEALGPMLQKGQMLDEFITLFSRALLEHRAAWQELAREWVLDWQPVIGFDVIGAALKCAEQQAGDEPMGLESDVLEELRRFIEVRRAEWE